MIQGLSDFRMQVSKDKMSVLLNATITQENIKPLLTRVSSELSSLRIVRAPSAKEILAKLVEAMKDGPKVRDYVIMRARDRIPQKDAEFKWALDFHGTAAKEQGSETFRSYWERLPLRNVKSGQLIGRHNLPQEGKAGYNVFGEEIAVQRAARFPLEVGPGIEKQEKEGFELFFTGREGRLRWGGMILAVDSLQEIGSSELGKDKELAFEGAVLIKGDVIGAPKIKAVGDIQVDGLLETSGVQAGGGLFVGGGISCVDGGKIKVEGGLCAKMVQNANIEAGDDVVIEGDIINSMIMTRGALVAPDGRMVGGRVTASGGVILGEAGGEGRRKTTLSAGQDFALDSLLEPRRIALDDLDEELTNVKSMVEMLMTRQRTLNPEQREKTTMFYVKQGELQAKYDELSSEISDVEKYWQSRSSSRIVIHKKSYPGITIAYGDKESRLLDLVEGRLSAELRGEDIELHPSGGIWTWG